LGAFEHEYVRALNTLGRKHCSDPGNREVCLRVIVDALKFAGAV
jgi:hypothetical protein